MNSTSTAAIDALFDNSLQISYKRREISAWIYLFSTYSDIFVLGFEWGMR
jgi:hypothetical protein